MLELKERDKDPLIAAASELNVLRSRSPAHGEELIDGLTGSLRLPGSKRPAEEQRLRHVACLLAESGGGRIPITAASNRSHHRQCLSPLITHVPLLPSPCSPPWLVDEELLARLRELAFDRVLDRARVLARRCGVAYLCLRPLRPLETPMLVERGRLVLRFDNGLRGARGERSIVRACPSAASRRWRRPG